MTTIAFQVNKKLEIICDNGLIAKCVIQQVEEEHIYINIPMYGGLYYPLNRGDIIEAYYTDNKENIYKFKTEVIGRKYDKIPLIIINKPVEVYKVQRRRYVRIDFVTEISYALLKDNNENTIKSVLPQDYIKGYSVDISGGGIKVKISSQVKLGDYIMISVPLENEKFSALCKVVRVEKDENSKLFICGVAYEDMDSPIRERIIQFIFKAMRKTIRSK